MTTTVPPPPAPNVWCIWCAVRKVDRPGEAGPESMFCAACIWWCHHPSRPGEHRCPVCSLVVRAQMLRYREVLGDAANGLASPALPVPPAGRFGDNFRLSPH